MNPRYTLIEVENRGHRVAVIEDTSNGEVHKIRRKGGSFFYSDRNDTPVKRNPELVAVAREALDGVTGISGGASQMTVDQVIAHIERGAAT